jgi:glycosyltransferase involved in cell wall biosynthesis
VNPEISVVIPTYNRKNIVIEAINSVLRQEPKNFEVIVVDDGSTDGTKEFLESIKLPIRVVQKVNGGVSSARNVGIKNAGGDYIAFFDSDDIWLPGILKAQIGYLKLHPNIPLVYVDEQIEIGGKIIEVTRFTMKRWTQEELSSFDLPALGQSPAIQTSAIMVRKSIFDEVGYFNEELRVHEDIDMWNRISERYEFGYIEKPLAVFRWEADAEHLVKASAVRKFVDDGVLYMKLYEERRKGCELTEREKMAIQKVDLRMEKLGKLIDEFEKGTISEKVFGEKRQEISME